MNRSVPFPVLSTASKEGVGGSLDPWNDRMVNELMIDDTLGFPKKHHSLHAPIASSSQSSSSNRRRRSMLLSSSLHNSSSRLMDAVSKTVQLGLQSITKTSGHKSSTGDRYEVMSDDGLSRVLERSDEFTMKEDEPMQKQQQQLLPKESYHSGKSSDNYSFAEDSMEQEDDAAENFIGNDEAPLRLPKDCLQMNFDTFDMEIIEPTYSPISAEEMKKRLLTIPKGSDHRSVHPLQVDPPTRLSPRSLRKFRLVGIADSSLQPFQPKLSLEDDETLATPLPLMSPVRNSPRRRLQRRKQSSPMNPQIILDRISFGPSSQHYCNHRGMAGRTAQRSGGIQPPPLHTPAAANTNKEWSFLSNHAPMEHISPRNDAAMDSKLPWTRSDHGGAKQSRAVEETVAFIPRRERVQFDFDPKNIDELSRAIAQARLSTKPSSMDLKSSHHKTSTVLVQPSREPTHKRRTLSKQNTMGIPRLIFQ